MPKAIVIGAGLAGLTAAWRLQQARWNVKVLEAGAQVGGRAVSVHDGDYLFDSGAVGLGTVYRDYFELVEELGLSGQVVKSSTISATVRNGRLHEMDSARPLTALTSRLLSLGSKLRMVRLFRDLAKVKPHLDIRDVAAAHAFDDESIERYAERRLNAELLEYFIEPLTRTVNLTRAAQVSKLEVMNSLDRKSVV
jgi:oxygen-dependent protoporphyrinogen oxidase